MSSKKSKSVCMKQLDINVNKAAVHYKVKFIA